MNVEAHVADTLLERGLPLPLKAPLFFRLLQIKPVLYQPTLGNKIRMNRLYLKMGIKSEMLESINLSEADAILVKHGDTLSRIIAYGMVTGYFTPVPFTWFIGKWLKYKLSPKKICAISYIMLTQSGTADFIDTTRCIEMMTILKPNLGQQTKRS